MKDEMQNLIDLIGALAEDIEAIKAKLDAKDASGKDEAVKRLAVKLEPVMRFFGGSTPENINDIFGSKETLAAYKKSLGDEMVVSWLAYTMADEKDMHERGIPTTKDLLLNIREMLAEHVDEGKRISENGQQNQRQANGFPRSLKSSSISKRIKSLWRKIPDGWYKNPFVWTSIGCAFVFLALFAVSWVQWHEYREENRRLRAVADKHKVTSVMLNELHPGLAMTVGAYEKLVETVGADSTLIIFREQVKAVKKESKNQANKSRKNDKRGRKLNCVSEGNK